MSTLKQYFGVKQNFHTFVKERQSRFYLIKIAKVQDISQRLRKHVYQRKNNKQAISKQKGESHRKRQDQDTKEQNQIKFKITFQIGMRSSQTGFAIQQQTLQSALNQRTDIKKRKQKNQQHGNKINDKQTQMMRINNAIKGHSFEDVHIFPFEKQEILSIKFQNIDYSKEYGYALVPLIPFIKLPHTKHQLEIDMVFQTDQKQIKNQKAVKIWINLYFLHNFKGRLFIEPIQADLGRNLAQIGQMSPIIRLFIRDNQVQTEAIDQGGIKPHWQSKKQNKFSYFNIPLQSALDDLFVYMFYRRQLATDQLIGKNRINLQQEGIYKNGKTFNKYVEEAMKQFEQGKFDDIKNNQNGKQGLQRFAMKLDKNQRQQNQITLRWEKRLLDDFVNKQQISKIQTLERQKNDTNLMKNQHFTLKALKFRQELQKIQLRQIYHQVLGFRKQIVNKVIEQNVVINTNFELQGFFQLAQKIHEAYKMNKYQYFKNQYDSIQKQIKSASQFPSNQLQASSLSSFNQQDHLKIIKRSLYYELQNFTLYTKSKMSQLSIPLMFKQPSIEKRQLQKQKQIGNLVIKYLFVYEFNYNDEEGNDNH